MEPQVRTAFETARPFDMISTLAPIGLGQSMRVDRNDAWRATRTPDGPSTVHLRFMAPTIEVEAWGPGAEWASARAAAVCGELDDATGFQPGHPLVSSCLPRPRCWRELLTGPSTASASSAGAPR